MLNIICFVESVRNVKRQHGVFWMGTKINYKEVRAITKNKGMREWLLTVLIEKSRSVYKKIGNIVLLVLYYSMLK